MSYLDKIAICAACYKLVQENGEGKINLWSKHKNIAFTHSGILVNGYVAVEWDKLTPSSIHSIAPDIFNCNMVVGVVDKLPIDVLKSMGELDDYTDKILMPAGVKAYNLLIDYTFHLIVAYDDCFAIKGDLASILEEAASGLEMVWVSALDDGIHVYDNGRNNDGARVMVPVEWSKDEIKKAFTYEYQQEQVLWCRKYAPSDLKDLDDNELCAAMDYIYHQLAARKD